MGINKPFFLARLFIFNPACV